MAGMAVDSSPRITVLDHASSPIMAMLVTAIVTNLHTVTKDTAARASHITGVTPRAAWTFRQLSAPGSSWSSACATSPTMGVAATNVAIGVGARAMGTITLPVGAAPPDRDTITATGSRATGDGAIATVATARPQREGSLTPLARSVSKQPLLVGLCRDERRGGACFSTSIPTANPPPRDPTMGCFAAHRSLTTPRIGRYLYRITDFAKWWRKNGFGHCRGGSSRRGWPVQSSQSGRFMAGVILENVSRVYPGRVTAVREINLEVNDREFLVLVGPSGCGKTTTLRMIAGLEELSGGTIKIGTRTVNDVPPKDRDIAMVFQNYALYPHMNVYRNMAFGLELREKTGGIGWAWRWALSHRRKEALAARRFSIAERVHRAARILDIEDLLERYPRQLSGGERQRVALGRAIVRSPAVFLFDEPLSNLDAKLRVEMRRELKQLHERLQTTMIYVTHDQVEALTLGDRIVVMNEGVIQQVGRADGSVRLAGEPLRGGLHRHAGHELRRGPTADGWRRSSVLPR